MTLPNAPAHEKSRDACCPECGSLFHAEHPAVVRSLMGTAAPEWPVGYDPAEADRLIGRDVPDPQ